MFRSLETIIRCFLTYSYLNRVSQWIHCRHLQSLYNVTMFKYVKCINVHIKLLKLLAPCSFYLRRIVLLSAGLLLVTCNAYSSALKKEAVHSSKTSANLHWPHPRRLNSCRTRYFSQVQGDTKQLAKNWKANNIGRKTRLETFHSSAQRRNTTRKSSAGVQCYPLQYRPPYVV
jgi:hypothetical protein